jgi:hypothetical protein
MSKLDSLAIEMQLDGVTWTDVTVDVVAVAPIRLEYGIRGNGILDRVASTGKLEFWLRNDRGSSGGVEGYYSPGHGRCRTGFRTGCQVRLKLAYEGLTFIKFYGRIPPDGIEVDASKWGSKRVRVTVLDWMEQAAIHYLFLPQLQIGKRMSEIVPLIVANMPIPPLATEYNTTQDVFELAFDTVRDKTTAIGELMKLALSELGYLYVKRDRTSGEVLVTDGRFRRSGITNIKRLPTPASMSGELLTEEAADGLLCEDDDSIMLDEAFEAVLNVPVYGTVENQYSLADESLYPLLCEDGDEIWLDEVDILHVVNPISDLVVSHGRDLANQIRFTTYPRHVDGSPNSVLWNLEEPIFLSGEIVEIYGRYTDPTSGLARVSARDMQPPVAGTDYAMNSNPDGTGTDMTDALSVTAEYGTDGVKYTLKNLSAVSNGYVTKLQARGRGIYIYDPVTLIVDDEASQAQHGRQTLTLDLKYQVSVEMASAFGNVILHRLTEPKTDVERVTFIANDSDELMIMALALEPGDKISFQEDVAGVSGDYFIHGVDLAVSGAVVTCSWILASAANDNYRFWELDTVGKSELGINTILGF